MTVWGRTGRPHLAFTDRGATEQVEALPVGMNRSLVGVGQRKTRPLGAGPGVGLSPSVVDVFTRVSLSPETDDFFSPLEKGLNHNVGLYKFQMSLLGS